jgi:hypothetical protein
MPDGLTISQLAEKINAAKLLHAAQRIVPA